MSGAVAAVPAAARRPIRVAVGPADLLMVLALASYAFAVVNVPVLPVSPQVVMPFVLVAACLRSLRATLRDLLRLPHFVLVMLLYAIQIGAPLIMRDADYETIAGAARSAAAATLMVALPVYAAGDRRRCRRIYVAVVVLLTISVAWFLLELAVVEPFVTIRRAFYEDIYRIEELREGGGINIDSIRTGLTPFAHDLGYVLSALVPLLFLPILRGRGWVRFAGGVSLGIALLGLQFSAQRSALLSSALAVLALMWMHRQEVRRVFGAILAVGVVGGVAVALSKAATWTTDVLQPSTLSKLIDPAYNADALFRILLQVQAARLVLQYPLGLAAAGVTWEDAGFYAVLALVADIGVIDRAVAVHNAYLGPALGLGLVILLPTLVFLVVMVRRLWRNLRWAESVPDRRFGGVVSGASAALVSLLSVQSLTHNDGILTGQKVVVIVMGLFLAAEVARVRLERAMAEDADG